MSARVFARSAGQSAARLEWSGSGVALLKDTVMDLMAGVGVGLGGWTGDFLVPRNTDTRLNRFDIQSL